MYSELNAVLLGGRAGPLDTSDFIEVFNRAKIAESVSWRSELPAGVLPGLCTVVVGNPLDGDARNVATPVIPEFTITNEAGFIVARGWRMLLTIMIKDRWIRPTEEIRALLGDSMFDQARKGLGCV